MRSLKMMRMRMRMMMMMRRRRRRRRRRTRRRSHCYRPHGDDEPVGESSDAGTKNSFGMIISISHTMQFFMGNPDLQSELH